MRKLRLLSAVLVLLIVMTSFSGCFSLVGKVVSGQKTVDLKDYITVSFGEYEGYSEPSFEIDYAGIVSEFDIEKFNKYKEKLPEDVQLEIAYISSYAHFFSFDFRENYENVSNGDKIYIDVTLDPMFSDLGITLDEFCKKCGIKFKDTKLQYKVSGLKELDNAVDIMFPEIEQYIEYEGPNGYGTAAAPRIPEDFTKQIGNLYFVRTDYYHNDLDVIYNNKKVAVIAYNVDFNMYNAEKKLSGGDELRLYATVRPENGYADENGFISVDNQIIFPEASKMVTVPDLGVYLTSMEQLTPDVIEKIKQLAYDEGRIDVYDIYFTTYNPGKECSYNCTTLLMLVTTDEAFWRTEYYIDKINDIVIKPDGTVEAKYDDWYTIGDYTYEAAVSRLDYDYYSHTKIN